MSYVRFSADSDVYLFATTAAYPDGEHVIECCACQLGPVTDFPQFRSKSGALDHLRRHEGVGHDVPARAFARIKEDGWLPAGPCDVESAVLAQIGEKPDE